MLMKTLRHATVALLISAVPALGADLPEVTTDGLHLLKHTKLRAVYMKPGANLDEYDKVALLACYVAFNKNWQRDHNDDSITLTDRITDEDMKNIRERLRQVYGDDFSFELTRARPHGLRVMIGVPYEPEEAS